MRQIYKMINDFLDVTKQTYCLSFEDVDISYKGTKEDTANGKREEYTIVRWIRKNGARKSD